MADLSAYVDFSVKADKSLTTPVIVLTDISNYPTGVPQLVTGVFTVTQPDGLSVAGNFITPDVFWNGTSLTAVNNKELRLATDGNFQQGNYTITYVVKATGYSDTIKTKTFTLAYEPLILLINDLTDPFTPSLQQIDNTNYNQNNFAAAVLTRNWLAYINYIGEGSQFVTGDKALFDMAYNGAYYDAKYIITLNVVVSLTMIDPFGWVTLVDKLSTNYQIDAYTPPTMQSLANSILTLFNEIQAGTYCGGKPCGCGCPNDEDPYELAQSLYDTVKANGCNGDVTALYPLVSQMQKIFSCNGGFAPPHTNAIIPAYNFGCGSSGGAVHVPIQFTVGSGAQYAPANNTLVYTNPTIAGNNNYTIYRQAIGDFLASGDFNYNSEGGFTLTNASPESSPFQATERFTLAFYAPTS